MSEEDLHLGVCLEMEKGENLPRKVINTRMNSECGTLQSEGEDATSTPEKWLQREATSQLKSEDLAMLRAGVREARDAGGSLHCDEWPVRLE